MNDLILIFVLATNSKKIGPPEDGIKVYGLNEKYLWDVHKFLVNSISAHTLRF